MKGLSFLKSTGLYKKKSLVRDTLSYLFLDKGLTLLSKSHNYQNNMMRLDSCMDHITLKTFQSQDPLVEEDSHIAHLATLQGNVSVGKGVRVEPFTAIRALDNWVELCDDSFIGSYVTIHVRADLADSTPRASSIGSGSVVEDRCVLTNAIIGENVWIGENSVLQEGVIVQDCVRVLPGSVIAAGKVLLAGKVYGGMNGGEVVGQVSDQDAADFENRKQIINSDLKMMDKNEFLKYYYINS